MGWLLWFARFQDLSSMAKAAEKFRREMDAMREELQGPKADPVRLESQQKLLTAVSPRKLISCNALIGRD